jgi:hypothetical protein
VDSVHAWSPDVLYRALVHAVDRADAMAKEEAQRVADGLAREEWP